MAQTINIVPLESGFDLAKIRDLYIACFNAPDKGENWTQDTAKNYFDERIEERSVFYGVRGDDGEVLAVLGGGPYEKSFIANDLGEPLEQCFYVFLIAVHQAHQGRGVGMNLTREVLSLMQENGYERALARCRVDNAPVRKVFERNGFNEVKRYTSQLGGVECERVILLKDLL